MTEEKSNYQKAHEIAGLDETRPIRREDAAIVFAILAVVDSLEDIANEAYNIREEIRDQLSV